ncbi:MAG: ATP-binding cassette domain-containing protein [Clostridiales bacterium]|nr:ATP-binding cassette domain-containing protein [Clostridiales bacterium]
MYPAFYSLTITDRNEGILKMALYEINHLTFTYPLHPIPTLQDINLSIHKGDFVLLFGPSGSGKSTLLRQLKKEVWPVGERTGTLVFEGQLLEHVPNDKSASRIGMVFQNPDQQIVMSTVYEELAFGMENLGFDPKEMQRRIGEISTFLGINHWLYKSTSELSGGQKQLLNLASVMTLYPDVLLLDEPTSQLDPIATQNFLNILGRLNEEFSITIIMTEHHLEEVFPLVDMVYVLEKGMLTYTGKVREAIYTLYKKDVASLMGYLPSVSRLYMQIEHEALASQLPLTPKEAKVWFDKLPEEYFHPLQLELASPSPSEVPILLSCQDIYFQYTKDSPLVLERIRLDVPMGAFLAILGGNGSGKSTFLKVLAGILPALKGKIKTKASIGYLPQNPMALFHEPTVLSQLQNALPQKLSQDEEDELSKLISFLSLQPLLEHHPYDLSGGEMQKVALATVLLTKPDLLLLDEPTKGLDPYFKKQLAQYLNALLQQGKTIIMVSHDMEFVARYATLTTLMFSGKLLSLQPTTAFFSNNVFYTTSIHRTVKARLPHAITLEEVNHLVRT